MVAAGLAARHNGRAGAKRSGLVALSAINGARRGQNYLRPNAKGSKPMINRHITQDILRDSMKGWTKKYRTAGDIEDIMKKTIYGRVQFQFASEHFTDDLPWFKNPQSEAGDHLEDDPLYVRKYLEHMRLYVVTRHGTIGSELQLKEPAKFKKLEIANWEMPENYTRSTHIFDLVQTSACLNRACYYAMEAASKGATFLFTGTKEQASKLVKQAAKRTGQHYCDSRFVGGLLTNFNQAQGAWQILSEQEKEKNRLKIGRLIRKYEGVQRMNGLPDIVHAHRYPRDRPHRLQQRPDLHRKLTEAIRQGQELRKMTAAGDMDVQLTSATPSGSSSSCATSTCRWCAARSPRARRSDH